MATTELHDHEAHNAYVNSLKLSAYRSDSGKLSQKVLISAETSYT